MSKAYRTVDVRAVPATRGNGMVLDEFPPGDAPEPAATNQRAVDATEALPPQARDPSAIDTQDKMIPNGWFG